MKKSIDILRTYVVMTVSFLAFSLSINTALSSQCTLTNCPPTMIELEAGQGECSAMLTITPPTVNGGCTLTTDPAITDFPIGMTTVTYSTSDGNDECTVQVVVAEFEGAIGSVACNDLVQVSLDNDCQVEITPDVITEGGPYGCMDLFSIQIGGISGNIITAPGTYTVTVTTPAGNSCWGQVFVEDKIAPELDCTTDTTYCSQSTLPGSSITEFLKIEANVPVPIGVGANNILIPVSAHPLAVLEAVSIDLAIEFPTISDLSATLTDPSSGATIDLFTSPGGLTAPGGCNVPNLNISLGNDNPFSHTDLENMCGIGILGAIGAFEAEGDFSDFDGLTPTGMWVLTINNAGANTGILTLARLDIASNVGEIDFPIEGPITTLGNNQYTVGGYGACGPITLTYNDQVNQTECTGDYWEIINRNWVAEDPSGNKSTCTQEIYVVRGDLSLAWFPPNYDDFYYPAIDCYEDVALNEFGNPDVTVTGVPSYPSGSFCPNIQFTYTDLRIDICPSSYKVIREWKLLDWCTGEVVRHDQIIKVVDDEGPNFECPFDFGQEFYIQDAYSCTLDFIVPIPEILTPEFECNNVTWTVEYKVAAKIDGTCQEPSGGFYTTEGVTYGSNNLIVIEGLPEGCVWLKYIARDECNNKTERICELEVVDGTPPVAVCIEFTVVSLGADGCAKIYATSFDNGSNDNCMIDGFAVRRMLNPLPQFDEYVKFCCEDIGGPHMVEFRVTDKAGLVNTCMVEVTVQDKLPPVLYCPDDYTTNCEHGIPDPDVSGWPLSVDNTFACHGLDSTYTDAGDVNNCGVGHIVRTFRYTDVTNNTLFATCTQDIWVYDPDPFFINRNNDFDPLDDIEWPLDVTVTECFGNLDPENLGVNGFPVIYDDECSLVAATYVDQVFTFVPDACEKIIRDWTVIDWCQYEENFPQEDPNENGIQDGIWYYTQIVKLQNEVGPTFSSCEDTLRFDGYGPCFDYIDYQKSASDDCTEVTELTWHFKIDFFNDGTIDEQANSNDISDVYFPFGSHHIKWIVEDMCGNQTKCEQIIVLEDAKNPTPYCRTSITTVVMNNNGEVELWASDYDLGSTDNCSPFLYYSFSPDIDSTNILLTCDDIPNGEEATITLQMWVTDVAGNQDFCEVYVELQDNNGDACDNDATPAVEIRGNIRTEDTRMVNNVRVEMSSSEILYPAEMTGTTGIFSFHEVPINTNFNLAADKNDNPMNGVSTLDLVLIQKHILGLQNLNSPYKLIAADIDGSQSVTAVDLVNLRKLILGIYNEFPNNQGSWKFVDAAYNFNDNNNPFPFSSTVSASNVNANMYNMDFIGIKMGDVNYNASTNLSSGENIEFREARNMEATNIKFSEGDKVRVPVYLAGVEETIGFQFSLGVDDDLVEYVGLESGRIEIGEKHTGVMSENGDLAVSVDLAYGVELDEETPLFYVILDAVDDGMISEALTMTDNLLNGEIYDEDAISYNLSLDYRDGIEFVEEAEFYLEQNKPNPFSSRTEIGFYIPESADVVFKVMDITGREVLRKTESYQAGRNIVALDVQELNSSGVLYYSIETENWFSTRKMIVIK